MIFFLPTGDLPFSVSTVESKITPAEPTEVQANEATKIIPTDDVTEIIPAHDVTKIIPAHDVTVPAADEEEADYVPGSPYDEVFEELERSAREEKTTGFVKKWDAMKLELWKSLQRSY